MPQGLTALPRAAVPLALLVILAGFLAVLPAQAQSPLPRRAIIVGAAADGIPTAGPVLPPADPSYCAPAGGPGSTPPNSVLGLLTISGQPAPVNTVLQVVFGTKLGPADYVKQAGGYRIDYAPGPESCANATGAPIGILVNGVVYDTSAKVGDEAANPFLRFDIAAP